MSDCQPSYLAEKISSCRKREQGQVGRVDRQTNALPDQMANKHSQSILMHLQITRLGSGSQL